MFSAIKKMRASDQILEKIRQTILSGKFGVEERLPSERELAEQFGVNRGTVREALKILEESGLVKVQQGGGARVTDFWRWGGLDLLPYLVFRHGEIDLELLGEILEARRFFCTQIARLAATRRTQEDLDRLSALYRATLAAGEDRDEIQRLDFEFFYALSRAAGNRVFLLVMNAIRRVYFLHREAFRPLYETPQRVATAQEAIVQALQGQDPAAAAAAVERYMAVTG